MFNAEAKFFPVFFFFFFFFALLPSQTTMVMSGDAPSTLNKTFTHLFLKAPICGGQYPFHAPTFPARFSKKINKSMNI